MLLISLVGNCCLLICFDVWRSPPIDSQIFRVPRRASFSNARLVRSIDWLCNVARPSQLLVSILLVHLRPSLAKQQTSPISQHHGNLRSHPSCGSIHHWQDHFFLRPTFLFRQRCVNLDGSFFGRHFRPNRCHSTQYNGGLGSRLGSIHRP